MASKPEMQTFLGYKKDKDKWNDLSVQKLQEENKSVHSYIQEISKIESSAVKDKLSFDIFKMLLNRRKEEFKFRFHPYLLNQMFGHHTFINSFLINMHTVQSIQDAEDYIARVQSLDKNINQLLERLKEAEKRNIVPPSIVFPKVEEVLRNLLKGRPFTKKGTHILVKDFTKKVKALSLTEKKEDKLIASLNQALLESYKPSYQALLRYWLRLKRKSPLKVGLWNQPQGSDYYAMKLRHLTTTSYTPEQVHEIGLREVKRIHNEINKLKRKLKFRGSLQDFFDDFRNNKKYYYRSKKKYISDAKEALLSAQLLLPKYFGILPKRPIIIKEVERFRSKSAGSAFYQQPSIQGYRPGIFYINLHNMRDQSKYSLKALAFHETVPGHHLQISIALDLDSIPHFRRHMSVTAFIEGWALYSERLAGEMGLYINDYDRFGQLSMELMRACRLVVDTGLHYKKWNREKAIRYLIRNSDVSYSSASRSIDRYIVLPAQANAYLIGSLKILELRSFAKRKLGKRFDIREFHDQVLKNGAIPLNVLEKVIRRWVDSY